VAALKEQLAAAQKLVREQLSEADQAQKQRLAEILAKEQQAVGGRITNDVLLTNSAILDFALSNMGKKVSNGECAMLALEALKAAQARAMRPAGKTYVWGRQLDKSETALPGDIVQLEDCKFKNSTAPHHTQVVRKLLGPGRYEILEQNVDGRRTVGVGILDLNLLTQGEVVFYRPLPTNGKTVVSP